MVHFWGAFPFLNLHNFGEDPWKSLARQKGNHPTSATCSDQVCAKQCNFCAQIIESGICRDNQLDNYWKIKRQVWMIRWGILLQTGCAEFGGKSRKQTFQWIPKKLWLNIPPGAASNVHSLFLLLLITLLLPSVSVKVDPNLLLPSIFCKDFWMVRWIVVSKVWSSWSFSGHGREGSVFPPKRIIWSFATGWAKAGSKSLIPRAGACFNRTPNLLYKMVKWFIWNVCCPSSKASFYK